MFLGLRTVIYPAPDLDKVGEGIRVAAVSDPFGNRFGLIENPHFDAGQKS